MSDMIEIEVVYGRSDKQVLLALLVPAGSSIEESINLSAINMHFPEIKISDAKVGIFSRVETLDYIVQAGDRIEIYRPLLVDPKEVRKKRAAKAAAAKKEAGK